MSYCIFDIETVPDGDLWTAPAPKAKSRSKKDPFAPLYAHRVIALGMLCLNDDYILEHVGCLDTVTFPTETRLISTWSSWMETQPDRSLVSFNGRCFDMAVLQLRGMRLGVQFGWYTDEHSRRYGSDKHLDLFDEFILYGANARDGMGLGALSMTIGLPGKGDNDGSKVAGLFAEGKVREISLYCQQDLVRTAFLFLRRQLMRGRITLEKYRESARGLIAACHAQQLNGVLFGGDDKRLLLEE